MPQTHSSYGLYAFLLSLGLFLLIWIITWVATFVICMCRRPTWCSTILCGSLFATGLISINFLLAFAASFERLPIAASVILCVLIDVVAGPAVAVFFSRRHPVLFRHPPALDAKEKVDRFDAAEGVAVPPPDSEQQPSDLAPNFDSPATPPADPITSAAAAGGRTNVTHRTSGASSTPTNAAATTTAATPLDSQQIEPVSPAVIPADTEAYRGNRLLHFKDAVVVVALPNLAVVYTLLVVAIVVLHVVLANGCFCSSPNEFTTWATRASQTRLCERKAVCHLYATVGSHCSMVSAVSHYVADGRSDAPVGAVFEWIRADVPSSTVERTHAGTVNANAATLRPATQTMRGDVIVDRPVREDWRVVARAPLLGLACGVNYTLRVAFVDDNGATIGVKEDRIATLPSAADVDSGARTVTVAGGGDLEGGDIGQNMMQYLASRAAGRSDVVIIGGDVAYANNMRYCYRRWDNALIQMRKFRRAGGALPLYITTVGNHEAGGYLAAPDTPDAKQARRDAYTHYTTFFPSPDFLSDFAVFPLGGANASSSPVLPLATANALPAGHLGSTFASTARFRGDDTITMFRAYIGNTAWIVLDSDIMFKATSQREYLEETLTLWDSLLAAGSIRKIVVMYHCPGLPTVRAYDNAQAKAVRDNFFPSIFQHNVSLVLENHDHAYKRTFRLGANNGQGGTFGTVAPSSVRGAIFTGDGALGVSDLLRDADTKWYHNVSRTGNTGFVAVFNGTGHVAFTVYDELGNQFDTFVA